MRGGEGPGEEEEKEEEEGEVGEGEGEGIFLTLIRASAEFERIPEEDFLCVADKSIVNKEEEGVLWNPAAREVLDPSRVEMVEILLLHCEFP